jgi:hypothetical protein
MNPKPLCILLWNVKDAQVSLQKKTITWAKDFGKGRQEWEKVCIESGMQL